MWFGACTSTIGTWMQSTAQAWLVYDLSKDSFYLGLDTFLAQVPIILFSLVGGVIADRMNRRNLLLISQYVQMTTALILDPAGVFQSSPCLAHPVPVLHRGQSRRPSAALRIRRCCPTLVGKEDIPNAIAMNSIQFNLARVIGPTLGGIALTTVGAAWCFGLNSLSFIAVVISLYMINVKYIPAKSSEPILDSMRQGIGFIRKKPGMDGLIVLAFGMTLLGIPLLTFLPVFAKDVLHGGAKGFTQLLAFSGARLGLRRTDRGRLRQDSRPGPHRAHGAGADGLHHLRVFAIHALLALAAAHLFVRRRHDDFDVHGQLAGAGRRLR